MEEATNLKFQKHLHFKLKNFLNRCYLCTKSETKEGYEIKLDYIDKEDINYERLL